MHALELEGLCRVDLEDDPVGLVDPRLVVANRGGRDQLAVRGDAGNLEEGDVEVTEEALPDHLSDVRQVEVEVVHQPCVDLRSGHGVGLVGHSQVDAIHGRQRATGSRKRPSTA